jgi:hypothetical protein
LRGGLIQAAIGFSERLSLHFDQELWVGIEGTIEDFLASVVVVVPDFVGVAVSKGQ